MKFTHKVNYDKENNCNIGKSEKKAHTSRSNRLEAHPIPLELLKKKKPKSPCQAQGIVKKATIKL